MKKLIISALFLFCAIVSFGEDLGNFYKRIFNEMDDCRSKNAPSLGFKAEYRNGFLKKNSEVEIQCGDEIVKVIAVDGFFVSRKIIFRGKEINLYRLNFSSSFVNGRYGMSLDGMYSFYDKQSLHLRFYEGFDSYKSLDDFKRFLTLDDEYQKVSNKRFIEYYNSNGVKCGINIVEDEKYNVIHLKIYIDKVLIDWKETNNLPPSPFKPNFKIEAPKKE